MELRVKQDGLDKMTDTFGKDAEDLDTSIERIIKQLEILRGIWEGQDADMFFGHAREYFEKMREIPRCMRNMQTFTKRANKDFNDGDEAFSKELEVEVDEEYIEEGRRR
jgi:WXG100 family type VII secretion target